MTQLRGPHLTGVILPRCRKLREPAVSPAATERLVETANVRRVVTAKLLSASGLHWIVQLGGDVEAVVEYDARRTGIELVKVDSRVVCREGTTWGYNGRFSFSVPSERQAIPAELEIRTSLWSAVTEFHLRLHGITVFACESTVETCSLPLPARAPSSSRAELPLPHRG